MVWKKNNYSKQEKKLKPILFIGSQKNTIVVADSISKIYAINANEGNIIWSKYHSSTFNSQLKIYGNKVYIVDSQNTLNCYSIKDGSKIWELKTGKSFINSNKKLSIAIKNDKVFFNNSFGEVTAVNANNGALIWQISTQNSLTYENIFNLKTSTLIASNNSILFSNNKNEFYSINQETGLINWKQKINSNLASTLINNTIFSVSIEGYLFLTDYESGNIIRVTNIFNLLKNNKKKIVVPVGFVTGYKNIYLSTSNGKLLVINIKDGKTKTVLNISKNKISKPFISNNDIFIAKENSIIRFN